MADDYDGDEGYLDMDDGWIYVEDEFNIADELAEGQFPDPGFAGTNYEIDMENYDYDFFGYWDDMDYADDAYWDYGLPVKDGENGQKRKRVIEVDSSRDKRMRIKIQKPFGARVEDREAEPLLFRSREERNRSLKQDAPRTNDKAFALLPDWKERFANADGVVIGIEPEAMKRAAEAQDEEDSPRKMGQAEDFGDEEEGDWEDEVDGEEGELAIDPEMFKTILRERLGAAGMEGMDEEAFMDTIQKMMSGEGGGDAAGDLANALLGKVTSEGGDEAVSGWLSQQGVSLEEDDASSVATAELAQGSQKATGGQHESPPDSAVSISENSKADTTKRAAADSSPNHLSKKRAAAEEKPVKSQKKVKFDVSSSATKPAPLENAGQDGAVSPSSDDPLASDSTAMKKTPASKAKGRGQAGKKVEDVSSSNTEKSAPKTRKRKAIAEEEPDEIQPAAKKTRSRELQQLGAADEVPSPAPPAKRTRSARAKGGK